MSLTFHPRHRAEIEPYYWIQDTRRCQAADEHSRLEDCWLCDAEGDPIFCDLRNLGAAELVTMLLNRCSERIEDDGSSTVTFEVNAE